MCRFFAMLGVAALLALPKTVGAEELCGDRKNIIDTLEKRYQELPISKGLSGSGQVFEIYVSTAGSWTILVTRPTGIACILSAGEDWHHVPFEIVVSDKNA